MEIEPPQSSTPETPEYSFIVGVKAMWTTSKYLNCLLVLMPVAFFSFWNDWNEGVTFTLALFALAPLAERLGFVTEQCAIHTNETIGGLLNASFGNATELIVAISALRKGLYRLVQLSLLGSVLSNMLLVLGCAFFAGGLKRRIMRFNTVSAQVNMTLLTLSVMGLMFPTIMTMSNVEEVDDEMLFSRITSIILFLLYIAFLYFQLFTHKELYEGENLNRSDNNNSSSSGSGSGSLASGMERGMERRATNPDVLDDEQLSTDNNGNGNSSSSSSTGEDDNDKEEDEDILGLKYAILWLCILTVFIAFLSEVLTDTISECAVKFNISGVFLSAIILPIVGNAAEHAGAVVFCMKGKVDLALGVAIGSSTQIALMVLPLLVLIGWGTGNDMSLNFGGFEASTVLLTVVMVTFAISHGTANWLVGLVLIAAYAICAAGFWVHDVEHL